MPRRNGRLPADNKQRDLLYRAAPADAEGADATDRSIPIVLATEAPVPVFDLMQRAVVNEVLRMDGMEIPQQVPLIDTHDRGTIRNVLGSIRELEVKDGQLVGRAFFSKDAQPTFDLYQERHLTDFSVGAQVNQLERDDDGNRTVTRSRLLEGSAVVAGQDPNAKATHALRAYVDPYALQEEIMTDHIKTALVERGLPTNATDAEVVEFIATLQSTPEPVERTATPEADTLAVAIARTEPVEVTPTVETVDRTAEILAIDEVCQKQNVSDDLRREWMADPEMTADKAARRSIEIGKKPVGTGRVEGGISEREKFYNAAEQTMLNRLADGGQINPDAVLERTNIPRDARQRAEQLQRGLETRDAAADLAYVRLPDLARMFLERAGERVTGLPTQVIVERAIAQREFVKRDAAVHTTGSFTNLMLDAANKTLLAGYDEADYTYSQWVRQAPSAADFKNLNRIRFGEMADPEVVPENNPYPEKSTQDSKESYKVEKHGEIFSISLEAIINDDLNAITRIPQMQGNAMRRKINKVCYAILTANEALSDGVTLFHASSHGANLDAAALAEAALDTGFNVMALQTGLSGTGTPLGLRPSYLIVPAALAATAHRLVGGNVVPVTSGTTVPLYGPGRPRPLTVIEEAQLDANSSTAWYLAANSSAVETVELTFLQGEESPVLSRMDGFETDNVKYKIRQTFNAKAIDFRGLYQGNA